jgi:hypothetical protein
MRALLIATAVTLTTACGGPGAQAVGGYPAAKIATAADALSWATASAPWMYALSTDTAFETDAGCPKLSTVDGVLHAEGGCTDGRGVKWLGSASWPVPSGDVRVGRYSYDHFGSERPTTCDDGGVSATMTQTLNGSTTTSGNKAALNFDTDLAIESTELDPQTCANSKVTLALVYSGLVTTSGNAATYDGHGTVGSSKLGRATVQTTSELIDSAVCAHEAASGNTTVTSGSTTMRIDYDGATKCDSNSTVKWSLNGVDQGELTGVSCSAAPGAWIEGAGLGMLVLLRRRRGAR